MSEHNLAVICNTLARWLGERTPENPNWPADLWDTFKYICRVHGVAPLLHTKLKAPPWLSDDTQSWLAGQYSFNQQRLAKMHTELAEILALFAAHSIPLMPLKGSILSVEFYSDPACRPMADLDLLIQPQDFEIASRLLGQLGYERDVAHWKHTEFSKPNNRRVIAVDCEHPDNPRTLEIHQYCRETFGGPTVDLTALMWKNSAEGHLLGQPAVIPKAEALWLHLLVHASYHLWQGKGRLIHLVDLALFVSQAAPEASVLSTVDGRFIYPALAMLSKYFPDALNGDILAAQQTRISPTFQMWADTLDLVNSSHLNPNPPGLYLPKAIKFTEGRPGEMMQALRFALLPGLAELSLDHPQLANSKVPWLAYFLLPLDWVKRLR